MKRRPVSRFFAQALGLGLLVAAVGCSKPQIKCTSPEDNPAHHYLRGMELLERGKAKEAETKFERALYCEDGFAPAHGGLAITTALKALGEPEDGHRKVESDKAFGHLKAASKGSKTNEDEFASDMTVIRVNTILKPEGWLKESEKAFNDARKLKLDERMLLYYEGREAADYFLGAAYLEGREFQKARDSFSEVLNKKKEGKWNEPADRGWKKTDKIVRALGGITVGDVGKQIAVKDFVRRDDMAALLADELKIDKLFSGRIPVRSQVDKMKADFTPADMLDSPFREEVLTMMKWSIRGLEPVYDTTTRAYLFKPGAPVTRKEFALVLEDIVIKLTNDEKIATAFMGHEKTPFPDVQPASAWYNAIMNATTRNLMETELSGEFRPDDKVDGAEALLAVRVLRQRLNIH